MSPKSTMLAQVVHTLQLKVVCGNDLLDRPVQGGYASDLLSDVMAHAKKGDLWITLQVHPNIVAVAVLKEISAVVLVNTRMPDSETIKKAMAERVPILMSTLSTYELAGRLYQMGIHGKP